METRTHDTGYYGCVVNKKIRRYDENCVIAASRGSGPSDERLKLIFLFVRETMRTPQFFKKEHLLARISSRNPGSIRFHQQNRFVECGCFEKVGIKKGRGFDTVWMQKHIGPGISEQ